MTPQERAARIAALRSVLDIAERYPDIPLPEISTYGSDNINWYLPGQNAARRMAFLERVLDCELTPGTRRSGDRDLYELKGTLGGLTVTVSAPALLVAERKVTGTRTVEDVEWIRKLADPESGDGK